MTRQAMSPVRGEGTPEERAMPSFADAHALIVGVANYRHTSRLPATVLNDASDVHDLLVDPAHGAYAPDRVQLLLDEQATRTAILEALRQLAGRATPESTVLFYVSGHGARSDNGDPRGAYLLPVDASLATDEQLANTAIDGPTLREAMRAIVARKVVMLFDCCHAAGIGDAKGALGVRVKSGLPDTYLDTLKAGRGRVVVASSRDDESSYVYPGARNSVFTEHLLAGLRGGVPAPAGLIRIFDLFDYLQPRVVEAQPNQHPIFKAELEDNFPVALAPAAAPPAKAAAPPAEPDAPFTHDLFVSYASADKAWVSGGFVPALVRAGVRVCVDYECFALGGLLIEDMERAVLRSRYTVAVLSPAYLASGFAQFESVLAEHLGLEERNRRYLGVLHKPCTPSLRVRARFWLDATAAADFDAVVARLAHEASARDGILRR